ncbi:hypothetical protein ACWY4P_27370 [Streptomyces sp. LZ34]
MDSPTTPPTQQGPDDGPQGQGGQQQGDGDRPSLEELWQQSAALSEQIAQHLERGAK